MHLWGSCKSTCVYFKQCKTLTPQKHTPVCASSGFFQFTLEILFLGFLLFTDAVSESRNSNKEEHEIKTKEEFGLVNSKVN